jgi:regulator of sigma D
MKKKRQATQQITEFRKTARALECDESEAKFDRALKKIGKAKAAQPLKRGK